MGPVPVVLAIVAVVGWGFALYLFTARSELQSELTRQNLAVGTLQSLQGEVVTLTSDRDRLMGERDTADAGLVERQQQLTQLQDQTTTAEGDLAQRQADMTAVEGQLEPLRAEIAGFDTARAESEQRLTESTQELADVGERLAEARAIEADLSQQLAALTEEAASLSADSSEAEARVQEARDAEASLQTAMVAAATELDRITAQHDDLANAVAAMTERRDMLAADNAAASEQRQSVQAIVTTLSEDLAVRSQQLAEVEQRMADLQAQDAPSDGEPAESVEEAGLAPGNYKAGPFALTLDDAGQFTLTNAAREGEITGRYEIGEDRFTLTDAEGGVGTAAFPMICAVASSESGMMLSRAQEGQCPMAGLTLALQE
jgi:septal ring factor EnvC (AmiA/AmiB activator)